MARHQSLDLFMPAEVASEVLRYLAEEGFEIKITDPGWLAKAHRDGFYVGLITGMSNAIITVDQSWIDQGMNPRIAGEKSP